jgi:4-hydroxybenzoate polyprenyltransferase/phosphoserine phosphatase
MEHSSDPHIDRPGTAAPVEALTHEVAEQLIPARFEQQVDGLFPLVVDLDGTLTRTDTLVESLVQAVKRHPCDILRLPLWLIKGRAVLKARVAARAGFAAEFLPYQEALCDYLRIERTKGRRIILATAANRQIAKSIAAHLGLFDEVVASDETRNLKGTAKLEAVRACAGNRFTYAGDSAADLPIWRAAQSAVLVGASPRVTKAVRRQTPLEREFPTPTAGLGVWLRELRVHQWLKNLLIFVPLFTAFAFTEVKAFLTASLAFLCWSLTSSATYVLNDLWDLDSDRRHLYKRDRPLASARIPIIAGVGVSAALLIAAFMLASMLSTDFLRLLLLYLALTSFYSLVLKQYVLLDVYLLAVLYILRIVAGSAAVGVTTSIWLLAFSFFLFFSLALLKRCTELMSLDRAELDKTHGRSYRVGDFAVLWPMGVGAGLCAVVVFTLFISASDTETRYATPQLLWLVALALVYWLGYLWIKTSRGEMHDDPIVFAVKDMGSRMTIVAMVTVTLAAHLIRLR